MQTPKELVALVRLASFVDAVINETKIDLANGKYKPEDIINRGLKKLEVFLRDMKGHTFVESMVINNIDQELAYYLWDLVPNSDIDKMIER